MSRISIIAAAAIGVFGLAACSQPAANGDAEKGDAAAPSTAPANLSAPAPGLWRLTTSTNAPGAPAMAPTEVCVTAANANFDSATPPATPGADCTTRPMTREGDAMVGGATCNIAGGMRTDTTVRVSGDFSRAYTIATTTRMEPAPSPAMGEITATVTAERIGDCPAA